MRGFSTRIARAFAALLVFIAVPAAAEDEPGWSIAIHGGAGTIARDDMTPQQDAAYRAALQSALDAGAPARLVSRLSSRKGCVVVFIVRLMAV